MSTYALFITHDYHICIELISSTITLQEIAKIEKKKNYKSKFTMTNDFFGKFLNLLAQNFKLTDIVWDGTDIDPRIKRISQVLSGTALADFVNLISCLPNAPAIKQATFSTPYYDCCIDTTKLIVPSNRQSIVQKIEHILNQTWQYDGTSSC